LDGWGSYGLDYGFGGFQAFDRVMRRTTIASLGVCIAGILACAVVDVVGALGVECGRKVLRIEIGGMLHVLVSPPKPRGTP
jgi:hypothetical protein